MNEIYHRLVVAKIGDAVAKARAISGVDHAGLRGKLREVFVRDLLGPLLPPGLGVATGKILTSDGEESPEQDAVIYDARILPPLLFEQTTGFVPIESALYSVEVKSRLDAGELRSAHENALRINGLRYLPRRSVGPIAVGSPIKPVIPAIFAFDTDLTSKGKTEARRYDEVRKDEPLAIPVICVADRSYHYWDVREGHWAGTYPPQYRFHETVSFVAGVMNTIAEVAESRGVPLFGPYVT